MKAFLMYKDQDFDLRRKPPWNAPELIEDLELDTLLNAMARRDCLKNPFIVRGIYHLAARVMESEKKHYWSFLSDYPSAILDRSISVLHMLVTALKELRNIANVQAAKFQSEGFTTLFSTLKTELSDDFQTNRRRTIAD